MQASKYMRLSKEMPQLLDSNTKSTSYFTGIEAAMAYLTAPEEVKVEVDSSTEPVTEKLIKQLKADHEKTLQQKAEALNQPPSSLRSSLPSDSVNLFSF